MAHGLTWWQADRLARMGRKVRRWAWENPLRWITYKPGLFYSHEETNTQLAAGVEAVLPAYAGRRVVEAEDFGVDEFEATDWTDAYPEGYDDVDGVEVPQEDATTGIVISYPTGGKPTGGGSGSGGGGGTTTPAAGQAAGEDEEPVAGADGPGLPGVPGQPGSGSGGGGFGGSVSKSNRPGSTSERDGAFSLGGELSLNLVKIGDIQSNNSNLTASFREFTLAVKWNNQSTNVFSISVTYHHMPGQQIRRGLGLSPSRGGPGSGNVVGTAFIGMGTSRAIPARPTDNPKPPPPRMASTITIRATQLSGKDVVPGGVISRTIEISDDPPWAAPWAVKPFGDGAAQAAAPPKQVRQSPASRRPAQPAPTAPAEESQSAST